MAYNTDPTTQAFIQQSLRDRGISPEIMAQLQQLNQQPTSGSGYNAMSTQIPRYDAPDGYSYWQTYSDYGGNGPQAQNIVKWRTGDLENKNSSGEQYGLDGKYQREAKYAQDKTAQTFLAALAAAGGVYGLGTMINGATGFAGSGASSFVGPPTDAAYASQMQAFEQSLSPYLSQATSGLMGPPTDAQYLQQIAPFEQSLQQYLPPGSIPKVPGAPTSGNGSSMIPDSVKGLLGPASTLLGALTGAQGQDASQSQTKKMDPRLEEYVYGDLLPRAKGLLAEEMSPARRAQWQQVRGAGLGLLSQPVAGNAFEKFYGKR